MRRPTTQVPRVQLMAQQAFATLERFLHIEAVSGIVLLSAAALALIWANSPYAHSYEAFWHLPFSIGLGDFAFTQSLHFWINDGLMTIFFLVVGMEVRREIHEGALSERSQAALPVAAAVGGVVAPAVIFLALNPDPARSQGWAVPTATDIAFAIGVLALLGDRIPRNVRVFLLALAVIDDIIAVLIIAFFYSGGLHIVGFIVAGGGILMVLALQRIGIGLARAYVLPGGVIWIGLLMTGAHPTLAGVVLGLMTPVRSVPMNEHPVEIVSRVARELRTRFSTGGSNAEAIARPLRQLRVANREILPPVVRVQTALHPWVAFGIMPLFALANAGVTVGGVDLSGGQRSLVVIGVTLALVVGKPLGVVAITWLTVRVGWCGLPPGLTWAGAWVVGLLAGIGFTMSIFIAILAFPDPELLAAAKLGVLLGSLVAALLGLGWGAWCVRKGWIRQSEDLPLGESGQSHRRDPHPEG